MLELFIEEEKIERSIPLLFALSFFGVVFSIIISILIFKDAASFPAVFLSAIAVSPTLMALTKRAGVDRDGINKMVKFYAVIFFGMATTFAFIYLVMPDDFNKDIYSSQLNKVQIAFFTFENPLFWKIFFNNIGLLFGFFLLSLFFGYGSSLLLSWNASILGVLWGNAIKNALYFLDTNLLISKGLFIWPYLVPEVVAYFLAAIAGGMLYVNLSKHKKEDVSIRSLKLLWGAGILTIVGAVIEVFILNSLV